MADTKTEQTQTQQTKIQVEVRARTEPGFRRLGRHFSTNPTEIEVTEEDYNRYLAKEPQLIVRRLDGRDRVQATQDGVQAQGATGGAANTATALQGASSATGGHTPGSTTLAEGKPLEGEPGAKKGR